MLRTRLCERFGIDAPIMVAPMGPDLTGPELVAAVCNAGGFGILQAQLCAPPIQVCIAERVARLIVLLGRSFRIHTCRPCCGYRCAASGWLSGWRGSRTPSRSGRDHCAGS